MHGLKRAEAAGYLAPPLLDWTICIYCVDRSMPTITSRALSWDYTTDSRLDFLKRMDRKITKR